MREYFYRLATDQINDARAGILKGLLFLLSYVYLGGVNLRRFLYAKKILKSHSLDKPVISVGNITMGGVGKTPLVEMLAEFVKQQNLKPVVLMRGYMGQGKDSDGLRVPSDEAQLLRDSLPGVPVLTGKDRYAAGKQALVAYPADVFILDDGFQHWRLFRDLDIVVIDATNPFGNHYLMPRGILRESLASLSRANILILTKTDLGIKNLDTLKIKLKKINPGSPIVEAVHRPLAFFDLRKLKEKKDLSFIKGKRICSFCSIGDPSSFEASLKRLGADVVKNFTFMDHHIFCHADIDSIVDFCRQNRVNIVVTTQKDAVKLGPYLEKFDGSSVLLSLKISLDMLRGKDEVIRRILNLFSR